MASHLLLLIVFSFFVSLIFAFLTKDDPGRSRIRFRRAPVRWGLSRRHIVLGWLIFTRFPLKSRGHKAHS